MTDNKVVIGLGMSTSQTLFVFTHGFFNNNVVFYV